MKKSMMILICVLLCMFAFTAGVSAESILPDVLPESNIEGIQLFADTAGTEVNVDNNVIDIMDKDIYSYSSYKGTATTITRSSTPIRGSRAPRAAFPPRAASACRPKRACRLTSAAS